LEIRVLDLQEANTQNKDRNCKKRTLQHGTALDLQNRTWEIKACGKVTLFFVSFLAAVKQKKKKKKRQTGGKRKLEI